MSIKAQTRAHILDLGTGSAILPCLLSHRFPDCQFTALERNEHMLALARHNTKANPHINIVQGNVGNMPKSWHLQFDQTVANPPFFDDGARIRMSKAKSPAFVAGDIGVKHWIAAMLLALKPRGIGTLIYRADGLETILCALTGKTGRIRILPIHSYADQPAKRILVSFRKGVKSESALLPPLIMHDKGMNARYNPRAQSVLNGEMPLILA